jgi:hypothetical protein
VGRRLNGRTGGVSTPSGASERAVAELLRPDPRLGVPVPAYSGRSLANLTSTVARASAAESWDGAELLPPLVSELDPFQGRRAEGPVIVLLVDGLGWADESVTDERTAVGYPVGWTDRSQPITTVFPTTTTVVLTSLTTAQPPSRHGVVGHRMYLPSYGVIAEILRMSPTGVASMDALAGPDWVPAMVSGAPTVFRRGAPGVALTRDRYANSAFTRMLYDGAEFVGFSTAADFAYRLSEMLRRPNPPAVIFAYWDDLDTVQHIHGPSAEFDAFEVSQVHEVLAAACRRLPPERQRSTTVFVTGDHGQVRVSTESELVIDREVEVVRHLLRPPTGDRRAAFFTARPGHLEALSDALERVLPEGSDVLPMRRAVEAGLFGPPPYHPELSDRLGDLLVLPPKPASVTYRLPGSPPRPTFRPGAHGGLDPAEVLVPLIVGPLSEL